MGTHVSAGRGIGDQQLRESEEVAGADRAKDPRHHQQDEQGGSSDQDCNHPGRDRLARGERAARRRRLRRRDRGG